MDDSPDFRRRSKSGLSSSVTGYVPMDEDRLQHSGVRGGKSYCLCVGICFLLIVALLNAMVTVGLIYLMSFKLVGMESMEFLPGKNVVRIMENLSADSLYVQKIYGADELGISGPTVQMEASDGSRAIQEGNHTVFYSSDFQVKTHKGKSLFSTNVPFDFDLYQVAKLDAPEVEVGSIRSSGRFDGLRVESFNELTLLGMEGVKTVSDSQIKITTAQQTELTSRQGAIRLTGAEGIRLSPDLPVGGKDGLTDGNKQYKLCVCLPSGKVFSVPIVGADSGCHNLNEDKNPCED